MRQRVGADRVALVRRYWPIAHTALQAIGGRWTVHAADGVMHLQLEPQLAELLKQVLPADAVVDAVVDGQ